MARKKSQRKGRTTEQKIDENGRKIYELSDQIKTLPDQRYDVKSQSEEGVTYRVSFGCDKPTCECRYHVTGKGCIVQWGDIQYF